MLIEQLINLEKVTTDNLKFMTDLRDRVMDGWSENLQIENWSSSCQGWSLYGFQTSHFFCDRFGCKLWLHSIQNHAWHRFQAFASRHLKFDGRCAVRFETEQTPFPRTGRNSDLLLCKGFDSEHAVLFLGHVLTQRPINDRKIERSYRRCFGRQQLLANSIEIFISHENKSHSLRPEIYKALQPCWLLNWVSIQQRLPPTRKRAVFVLTRPTRASGAGERPQELGRRFAL